MRITYLDVTGVESGLEPPFSQMLSMENHIRLTQDSYIVSLFVCLSGHLSVWTSVCLSVCLPVCLSVSVSLFVCLDICLSVCLSASLSVCLSQAGGH